MKFSWARLGLLTLVYAVIWQLIGLKLYDAILGQDLSSTIPPLPPGIGPEYFYILMVLCFLGWIMLGAILLVELVQRTWSD